MSQGLDRHTVRTGGRQLTSSGQGEDDSTARRKRTSGRSLLDALDVDGAWRRPASSGGSVRAPWVGRVLVAPLLALLWIYRHFVSPALPPACRYFPSCSRYAAEALQLHGPLRGTWLAASRLLRCHPFCEGGLDPVPPRVPARTTPPRSA